jgi:nicotinamide-nucleotide amidase
MFEGACLERLRKLSGGMVMARRVYRTTGLTESALDQRIAPIYLKYKNPETTILAKPGQVEIRLTAKARTGEEAERLLDELGDPIETELEAFVFAKSEQSLEEVVGMYLAMRQSTVAVAESCTGGLVSKRLTNVAGSSRYFLLGAVTYSNASKIALAGIPPLVLEMQGAVSEEVARGLAEGVRGRADATFGIGVTGVAGPSGGGEAKPVGTVFIAIAGPSGTVSERFQFPGSRERVRWQASQAALDMTRRMLMRM